MDQTLVPLPGSQGLDNVHKQRVAEVLNDPENTEKRRSRESLSVDVVKYESGPDGGEEVSMRRRICCYRLYICLVTGEVRLSSIFQKRTLFFLILV